ncbi:MAG: hypothetical protein KC594_17990 [Nitrospira sp.]|nr:hypothetical protein [Nitrospira sp.]
MSFYASGELSKWGGSDHGHSANPNIANFIIPAHRISAKAILDMSKD